MTDLDIEDAYNAGETVPALAMRTGRTIGDIRRVLAGI